MPGDRLELADRGRHVTLKPMGDLVERRGGEVNAAALQHRLGRTREPFRRRRLEHEPDLGEIGRLEAGPRGQDDVRRMHEGLGQLGERRVEPRELGTGSCVGLGVLPQDGSRLGAHVLLAEELGVRGGAADRGGQRRDVGRGCGVARDDLGGAEVYRVQRRQLGHGPTQRLVLGEQLADPLLSFLEKLVALLLQLLLGLASGQPGVQPQLDRQAEGTAPAARCRIWLGLGRDVGDQLGRQQLAGQPLDRAAVQLLQHLDRDQAVAEPAHGLSVGL